ncbi:hypothetical protein KKB18_11475 [bacterium]|nr:hypothetical protein [bacterium]
MSSPKIIEQLKASVNLDVRIFTTYGASYRGVIKDVTDNDLELTDVKVCDSRTPTPGSFYYPRKSIILLRDIAVVEGGYFEDEEDMSWLQTG